MFYYKTLGALMHTRNDCKRDLTISSVSFCVARNVNKTELGIAKKRDSVIPKRFACIYTAGLPSFSPEAVQIKYGALLLSCPSIYIAQLVESTLPRLQSVIGSSPTTQDRSFICPQWVDSWFSFYCTHDVYVTA